MGQIPFEVRATQDGDCHLIDSDGVTVMATTDEGATREELDTIAAWWNGDDTHAETGTAAVDRILVERAKRRIRATMQDPDL